MKKIQRVVLISILSLLVNCSLLFASVQALQKGSFSLDVRENQIVDISANQAKLSDILEAISLKTGINIKIEEQRGREIVNIDLQHTPLADVLKKLLGDDYSLVTKENLDVVGVKVLNNSNPETIKDTKPKTPAYKYSLRPGMEEWKILKTHKQMCAALQIPEDILHNMPTDSLLKTCLDYPLFIDIFAHDSLSKGFKQLIGQFNGLQELLSREDAAEKVLTSYIELDPKRIVEEQEKWTIEQKGKFVDEFVFKEMILAQNEIISELSSDKRRTLAEEVLKKFEIKSQYPEFYSYIGTTPCALIMHQILQIEGVNKKDVINSADPANLDQIVSDIKQFIGTR